MEHLWFYPESDGVLKAKPGSRDIESIKEAIELAAKQGTAVTYASGSDAIVTVHADSDPELIRRDLWRAIRRQIGKNVGPYPTPDLSTEERKKDMRIEAAHHKDWLAGQAQKAEENKTRRRAREAEYAHIPLAMTDEAWWKELWAMAEEDSDKEILAIADLWARIMQLKMGNGEKLEDIVVPTLEDACMNRDRRDVAKKVVAALSLCWKYGQQLEKWWNSPKK